MFIYIIAIAWIYVVLLMSATEPSIVAGIMTFIFYCVLPLSLFIYLLRSALKKHSPKSTQSHQNLTEQPSEEMKPIEPDAKPPN
jgi:bacteriorhodopsin